MKKQQHSKTKSKQEFTDAVRKKKIKFTTELSEIITQYYIDYLKNDKEPTISPIDIIGVLDFLKMDFYCRHNKFVILKQIERNQSDGVVHESDVSYS